MLFLNHITLYGETMNTKKDILKIIANTKVVPVIKIENIADTLPLLKAINDGGIMVAEITYRTSCAKEALELAIKNFPNMIIGAGTVINKQQAVETVALGVNFVVSPGFSEEIAEYCNSKNILYLGGCVTPTEIMKAISNGCDIIKFFPSENYGGIKTIKALSAPFPQIKFMPTGGINANNIKDYLACDKVIACGGSWMAKDSLIENKEFDKITKLCLEAVMEVKK